MTFSKRITTKVPRLVTVTVKLERGWKAVIIGIAITIAVLLGVPIPW